MKKSEVVKQCCGCNHWQPRIARHWPQEEHPPDGVCPIAGVYKDADQICADWKVYETPMTRKQRALWELSNYSGWSNKEIGLLFDLKEDYIAGCIKAIKANHGAEAKSIYETKLAAFTKDLALYAFPLATAIIQ